MADHSNRNQELLQAVQDGLKANDLLLVREIMQALHPSEVADLLEALPPETRDELWVISQRIPRAKFIPCQYGCANRSAGTHGARGGRGGDRRTRYR